LVGRGLVDSRNAQIDNRSAHGSASQFETPNHTMHSVGKRLF
jgi:hypothetical protein